MRNLSKFRILLAGVAISAFTTPALAAAAEEDVAANGSSAAPNGDIIVTATRRSETVHNVPMSIAAVSNASIEAQSVKTGQDLARIVPALRISPTSGSLGAAAFGTEVAIRGIASTSGSPTTGIYIDDVPIAVRRLNGAMGGGTAFPQLFDMDRVEVLRGPQGTLYGGSTEGGAIRFITKQPSFSKFSATVRGEVAVQEHGAPNYEAGFSIGGPIAEDKLAFNLTGWIRRDGGYVDHLSRFTGKAIAENTNAADRHYVHAQLAWKPTERATISLSYLYSDTDQKDSDQFWLDVPRLTSLLGPTGATNTYNYGPYKYGPYTTGYNLNIGDQFYTSNSQIKASLWPHRDSMHLPVATFDYDFDGVSVKLVSSYLWVKNETRPNYSMSTPSSRGGTALVGGFNGLPDNSPFVANLPVLDAPAYQYGKIRSWTEELRLSSNNPDSRLTWVIGAYFNRTRIDAYGDQNLNNQDMINAIRFGLSTTTPISFGFSQTSVSQEVQLAAFGEATFKVTDRLRVTAGVRETHNKFDYKLINDGPIFGITTGPVTAINSSVSENSFTPKFGLQYIANDNLNLYANAAKGFRAGGINPTINPICAASLAAAGFAAGAPADVKSDSLWTYEAGAKIRGMGGRARLNASAFYTKWKDVQTNITLTCGSSFNANAAQIVSKGFDLEGSFKVADALTISASLAYTDARYSGTVRSSPTTTLIEDGDRVAYIPKWSGNVSGQFDFKVGSHESYIRADYQFQTDFVQTLGPTTISYGPDMFSLPGTNYVALRAGMKFNNFDVSIFANNLTASTDKLSTSGLANILGRASCQDGAACNVYLRNGPVGTATTYRPRTWGISASYRY